MTPVSFKPFLFCAYQMLQPVCLFAHGMDRVVIEIQVVEILQGQVVETSLSHFGNICVLCFQKISLLIESLGMARRRSRQSESGAWAVIYCAATDSFLLGKRSGAVNNSGAWNFFGGRLDSGEGPCAAVRRELAEETGLKVKPAQLRKLRCVEGSKKRKRRRELHYYVLQLDQEVKPRLNREHSRYGWFRRDRLPEKFNLPTLLAIKRGLLNEARTWH